MNSDLIYVFNKGGIAEQGKFKQISAFKNYHGEEEEKEEMISPLKRGEVDEKNKQEGFLTFEVGEITNPKTDL